jgi:molecular chaperone GrpE (heat shock protein)
LLVALAEEELTDADVQKAQKAARTAWLASPPTYIAMEEFLFSYTYSVKKRVNAYVEKAEKLSFRFKKEVLLYEVCTYEEILTHSALRLKASPWPAMAAATVDLFAAYDRLQTILGINHIMAIHPAPHEPFNAFEHEVLMAEKQEGFATGEIIKVLNTGYKQGDKVILRANVIAAR